MFENTEHHLRISAWREFRDSLEESETPFRDLIDKYKRSPLVSIHNDPWNQSTWPTPWQLVEENQYCDFSRVLGMCYSLQLTDRFNKAVFEIHICTDGSLSTLYLLKIDDNVIGWDEKTYVKDAELPSNYASQTVYSMPPLL
jgi:hypothetical protein